MKTRRSAVVATWALAAAAVILVAVSWGRWRQEQTRVAGVGPSVVSTTQRQQATSFAPGDLGETVIALGDSSDFTLLPGTVPSTTEDATVVRVQMQRAALGALGLTVNEEHAADWIQIDLLVGDDGLPQAVRLPDTN